MEEEKKLYPLKICPIQDEYSWGTDEFALADLGYRDSLIRDGWLGGNTMSEIMDMYMDRIVGDNVFEYYGRQFPFQVKFIRTKGRMPLRVHPDDEIAQQRYDLLGREKVWYVLSASKDAKLFLGFAQKTDAAQVYEACANNSVESILNVMVPKAGDHFHIKPGTVHAAEGDMVIVEVSESSPLDFLLCGWGEEVSSEEFDENLTLADALDFIDYGKYNSVCCGEHHHHEEMICKIAQFVQFTASVINLKDPLHIYTEQFDSFMVYTSLKGETTLRTKLDGLEADYVLKEGETLLVPAECPDFYLIPKSADALLLEARVEKRNDPDGYINPEAKAHPDDCCDDDCGCDDEDECGCGHHLNHVNEFFS